jgi:hypothetical protein
MGNKVSDVKLIQHKYALRTLRQGYLYVFHEKHPRGSQITWEVYSISAAGTLWKQLSPEATKPVDEEPACSRSGHNSRCRFTGGQAMSVASNAAAMEEEADYVQFDIGETRVSGWLWRSPFKKATSSTLPWNGGRIITNCWESPGRRFGQWLSTCQVQSCPEKYYGSFLTLRKLFAILLLQLKHLPGLGQPVSNQLDEERHD